MNRIGNSVDSGDGALDLRLWRVMIASVAIAVVAASVFAPWRVTAGLALGGGLSLLNYHWLRTSVAAIFNVSGTDKPRVKASRYLIRYLVIGFAVSGAYWLQVISLPATIAGLSSFVPALFVEAFRQFYLVIIHREESF
jgi:hypothetical protein